MSSDKSQDEHVVQNLRSIILEYFNIERRLLPDNETTAFKAIQHGIRFNRRDFFQDDSFFPDCFPVFLLYVIRFVSGSDIPTDGNKQSIEAAIFILNEFISLCRGKDRRKFLQNLLGAIEVALNEGTVILPGVCKCEKLSSLDCDPERALMAYLRLLEAYLARFFTHDEDILVVIAHVMASSHFDVRYWGVRCLTSFQPMSCGVARTVLMLALGFASRNLVDMGQQYEDLDDCLVLCLKNAAYVMPLSVKLLIARDMFGWLEAFEGIGDSKVLKEVMTWLEWFVCVDRNNALLAGSFLVKAFKCFSKNKEFIWICKQSGVANPMFLESISQRYCHDESTFLARLAISPKLVRDCERFDCADQDLLYDLAAYLDTVPLEFEKILESRLERKAPKPAQVSKLIKYMRRINYFHYPDDVLVELSLNDEEFVCENFEELVNRAVRSKFVPLASLLIVKNPSCVDRLYTVIENAYKTDTSVWQIPYYPNAFNICQKASESLEFPKALFHQMYKEQRPYFFLAIAKEENLWLCFLEQLCCAMAGNCIAEADSALAVLKRVDDFLDIFTRHAYFFADFMFKLHMNRKGSTMFRLIGESFFDEYFNIKSCDHYVEHLLKGLQKWIVPLLVADEDTAGLRYLAVHTKTEEKVTDIHEAVLKLLVDNLAEIFTYIFCYRRSSQNAKALTFLEGQLRQKPTTLMGSSVCWGTLPTKIMLNIGHPDPEIQDRSRGAFKWLAQNQSNCHGTDKEKVDKFWHRHFFAISIDFVGILYRRRSPFKKYVISSFINSVEHIVSLLDVFPFLLKILSLVERVMKDESLRAMGVRFWDVLVHSIQDKHCLTDIIGPAVAMLLPYFDEYPAELTKILHNLIVENQEWTHPCFPKIAFIPIFSERRELSEINICLQRYTEQLRQASWCQQLAELVDQLESASPPYRRLVLEQMLALLKSNVMNRKEISAHEASSLWRKVWGSLSHEKVPENLILYGRCMAFLPFVSEAGPPELKTIKADDHAALMRTLITDYLVKGLEDSSSDLHHDHAACAIQLLLEQLGCKTEDPDSLAENQQWNLFDKKVQDLISPFVASRYLGGKIPTIDLDVPIFQRARNFNDWLSGFTCVVLKISMEEKLAPDFWMCCLNAIPDSQSLCMFMLPYLCFHNRESPTFQHFLQREWDYILTLLMGEREDKDGKIAIARMAIPVLFSLFDSLNKWNVRAGKVKRLPSWQTLEVADEKRLMEAAKKCEMYLRALQHLEFYIRDNNLEWQTLRDDLVELYEHLDDPDSLEAVRSTTNIFPDQGAILTESRALSPGASPSAAIELVECLFKNGRYERAFEDAVSMKMDLVQSPVVDTVIANSAVRLLRWDYMSKNPLHVEKESTQTCMDISIAKILCHYHFKEESLFKEEVAAVSSALVRPFVTAAMESYVQLLPIIFQYGLIEEIVDSYHSKRPQFRNWEQDIPLKPTDLEKIVAVRCALIDTCYADEHEKSSLITRQWLQLAHQCRKSGMIGQSNVFCTRARKHALLADDINRCLLETALTYWDMKQNDQALSILNTIKTDGRLLGEVDFLKARWSEELQSAESHRIMEYYVEAANLLGNSGKAFFAMANLADKRIIQMLQANEQINQGQAPGITRNSRGVSKFLGTPTPQRISTFLHEQAKVYIENYLKSLAVSPQYAHEIVCRILYLMFDLGKYLVFDPKADPQAETHNPFSAISKNQRTSLLSTMIKCFEKNVMNIKSAIWLNFVTQLISRVEQPAPLSNYLFMLIESALVSYPDATFWHLMSIKHSQYENRPERFEELWQYCEKNFTNVNRDRFERLKLRFLRITDHLIQLGTFDTKEPRRSIIDAKDMVPELIEDFNQCNILMPLTSTLNIPTGSMLFENPQASVSAPKILSMGGKIQVLPSLQHPKKISIHSTDNKHYYYLVKKDEDLRKDMRMMEFATFMNRLFSKDRQCKQRNLGIVTFAVVCLNERCGIIEWVKHTRGFRSIVESMIKEAGYGLSTAELRELMYEGKRLDTYVAEQKYKNFVGKILPAYPPMMHLWLVSQFNSNVSKWFQARLNYARSVAVWSMVGYILGLGDRHAENILISEKTGSCLHVDFCCLFDKSKSMPVPEIVPFRLTQNIVDGMGVLKTDGPFHTSACIVMETMRAKRQKVTSVWNTFSSDPLLEWKSGGKAGMEIQAKRTLEAIDNRLSGRSEDLSTVHSPECVVNELIEKATDPHLLSQMFIGWQAYL